MKLKHLARVIVSLILISSSLAYANPHRARANRLYWGGEYDRALSEMLESFLASGMDLDLFVMGVWTRKAADATLDLEKRQAYLLKAKDTFRRYVERMDSEAREAKGQLLKLIEKNQTQGTLRLVEATVRLEEVTVLIARQQQEERKSVEAALQVLRAKGVLPTTVFTSAAYPSAAPASPPRSTE